ACLTAGRSPADRQLLRRRPPALRADRWEPLRALRGRLLLVAEDDGPPPRRTARPASLLGAVRRLQPGVLPPALPRRAGDAAPRPTGRSSSRLEWGCRQWVR